MSKKSTKEEMKVREGKIIAYMEKGYGRQEISEKISFIYRCTKLAVCKQYDKLVKDMRVTTSEEKESARAVYLNRYEFLYRQAVERNQLKSAGEIIDKQSKLLGLYDKEQTAEKPPKITISPKPKLAVVGDEGESE